MAAWLASRAWRFRRRLAFWQQQVGQRALVILIVEERQQVLLLQARSWRASSRIGVGSLGRVAPSSASNKMTASISYLRSPVLSLTTALVGRISRRFLLERNKVLC